jgi:hypothetical protein
MNCPSDARTITLIQPDDLVLSATSSGSSDLSLDERGELALTVGQASAQVVFTTPKAGDYRFEYLYIDNLDPENISNISAQMSVVPVIQTPYGFEVQLAGAPTALGYVLRWRVVVTHISGLAGAGLDSPERLRVKLPQADSLLVNFIHPRSSTDYGFSELRVENLDDPVALQRVILVQVAIKTIYNFTVGLNPSPDNDNYYLIARTP